MSPLPLGLGATCRDRVSAPHRVAPSLQGIRTPHPMPCLGLAWPMGSRPAVQPEQAGPGTSNHSRREDSGSPAGSGPLAGDRTREDVRVSGSRPPEQTKGASAAVRGTRPQPGPRAAWRSVPEPRHGVEIGARAQTRRHHRAQTCGAGSGAGSGSEDTELEKGKCPDGERVGTQRVRGEGGRCARVTVSGTEPRATRLREPW